MPDNASLDSALTSGMKEDFINPKKPEDPGRTGRKPHVPKQVVPLSGPQFLQLHSQGTRSIDIKDPVHPWKPAGCTQLSAKVLNPRADESHHLRPPGPSTGARKPSSGLCGSLGWPPPPPPPPRGPTADFSTCRSPAGRPSVGPFLRTLLSVPRSPVTSLRPRRSLSAPSLDSFQDHPGGLTMLVS